MPDSRVFNPHVGPCVIDNGRTIGGSEWATVKMTPLVKDFIGQGLLLAVEEPSPESSAVSSEAEVAVQNDEQEPASISRRRRKPSVKE